MLASSWHHHHHRCCHHNHTSIKQSSRPVMGLQNRSFHFIHLSECVFFGHATAQVVSCRPFTVAAHFCARVSYVRILVYEVPLGQVFLSFPHQYESIATLNIHISSWEGTIGLLVTAVQRHCLTHRHEQREQVSSLPGLILHNFIWDPTRVNCSTRNSIKMETAPMMMMMMMMLNPAA